MHPPQKEIDTVNQGDNYYFYDAFKSKAENDRLKAEQSEALQQRQDTAVLQSGIRRRKTKLQRKIRYLVALVPLLPYVAHYFFRQQKNVMAAGSLIVMLTSALYFMWDFYFKPYNTTA